MSSQNLYIKKSSGFSQEVEDTLVSPLFYQPTPEGVRLLCAHYSKKYSINLHFFDLRGKIENPDNGYQMFDYFSKSERFNSLPDNSLNGFVLNHGQYHSVPVLVIKKDGSTSVVSFDSTSGSRIRGYFRIAGLFSDAEFYLNSGTRQVDSSSCITDAICILKEALQLKGVLALIIDKRHDTHPSLQPTQSRFFSIDKPANFTLFHMPEQLMLTAQKSSYLTDASSDLTVKLRDGRTLGDSRTHYRMQVSLTQDESIIVSGINSYLFKKSKQHKVYFDEHIQKLQTLNQYLNLKASKLVLDYSDADLEGEIKEFSFI